MRRAVRPALVLAGTELRRFTRDRTALLFVLVLPVAVIIVIGSTFSAAPISVSIGVVADGDTAEAERIVRALEDAETIEVRDYDDRPALDVAIRTGAVSGGVVVTDAGVTSVVDQADSNASAVRSTLGGALVRVGAVDAVARTLQVEREQVAAIAEDVSAVAVQRTVVDDGLGEATSAFAYTAPSNLVLFTFINSLTVGGVLVMARRSGVTQRWAAAPVPTSSLVGGVLLSRLGFAVVQGLIIVVIGAGLFGVDWGDPLGVAVVLVLFSVVSAGAGVLLGTLARTEDQTTAIGIPAAIGLGMLGGCMWPLEVVGDTMRAVGHATPHAWAMDALVVLVFDGGGVVDIIPELAVLTGFAGALLWSAGLLLRRRLV